jgi:chromosome segregation ATPase
MPESITQPAPGRESLETAAAGEDNSRMSEETTQNLPQDNLGLILVRLDSIDSRLGNVENRLSTLEDKVDRRLQETRPIWEQVLVRLDGVESSVQTLEGEVSELREEMRSGFRRFERAVVALSTEASETRGEQRHLEKRMDELEHKLT